MLKLFRFLRPYALNIAGVLMLLFLGAMADLYLPNLLANIVNKGIASGDTAYILKTGALMLLIAAGGVSCAVSAGFISSGVIMGFSRKVREVIFSRVESYSLYEFDKNAFGATENYPFPQGVTSS